MHRVTFLEVLHDFHVSVSPLFLHPAVPSLAAALSTSDILFIYIIYIICYIQKYIIYYIIYNVNNSFYIYIIPTQLPEKGALKHFQDARGRGCH